MKIKKTTQLLAVLLVLISVLAFMPVRALDDTSNYGDQLWVEVTRFYKANVYPPSSIYVTRIVSYAHYAGTIPLVSTDYDPALDKIVAEYAGYIPRSGITA